MAVATYVLEVRWDGINWTDETAYVLSIEYRRGKDAASQLTGRSVAGELIVALLNTTGRFSPMNTASPLTGQIVPGVRVRLRTTAPTAATRWQGFLDDIIPQPRLGGLNTATLRASGPLKWVAARRATTAVFTSILTGTAVEETLKDAGWSTGEIVLDAGQITMNEWRADSESALNALRDIEETEFGYVGETTSGEIVFEDLHHRLLSPHTVSQATFSDGPNSSLGYQDIQQLDPWREIFNRFEADVGLLTVQAVAALWTLAGEQPSIAPNGGTLELWPRYPTPDAPTQASHVRAWDTPSTAAWSANAASGGGGADLQGSITLAVSKFANAMKCTFTNNATQTAYLTAFTASGTAVYRNDPIRVINESTASQNSYGRRTYPLPSKYLPSVAQAQSLTNYGLSRYKDPLPVLSLTYLANESTAHLAQALTRHVSDRITVQATSTGPGRTELGINTDFFIESELHRISREGLHWVTYELSAASGDGGYWSLGASLLGQTTKLAP